MRLSVLHVTAWILLLLLASFYSVATSFAAEVKDYEVLRYLYLHTPCGMASVKRLTGPPDVLRFHADCQNLTAFPDGATVVCTKVEDDRSCRVEKEPTNFHSLDLLRNKDQK